MLLRKNRIIIVGGTSGIGLAIAHRLISLKTEVIVASRNKVKREAARRELDGKAKISMLDASDEGAVIRFFREIGPFDHLIATIKPAIPAGPFLTNDISQVKKAFDHKFWGQCFLARHGAKHIRPGGSITFTSGIASRRGFPGFSSVAAINGAIESLTLSLAVELAPIRVNAVCPGFVSAEPTRDQAVRALTPRLPLKKLAVPEEIAEAYLYLLSSSYTTGAVVVVDGGAVCS